MDRRELEAFEVTRTDLFSTIEDRLLGLSRAPATVPGLSKSRHSDPEAELDPAEDFELRKRLEAELADYERWKASRQSK